MRYGFCPSKKAWKRQMKLMGCDAPYPDTEGSATTFTKNGEMMVVLVTLADSAGTRPPTEVIGLMAHEAVHVWQSACEAAGDDEPSSEAEAYGVQSILQSLMDGYAKTRGGHPWKRKK